MYSCFSLKPHWPCGTNYIRLDMILKWMSSVIASSCFLRTSVVAYYCTVNSEVAIEQWLVGTTPVHRPHQKTSFKETKRQKAFSAGMQSCNTCVLLRPLPKFIGAARWEWPGDEAPGVFEVYEVFICDSLTNWLQNKIRNFNPSQNGSNSYLVDKPFMHNIWPSNVRRLFHVTIMQQSWISTFTFMRQCMPLHSTDRQHLSSG